MLYLSLIADDFFSGHRHDDTSAWSKAEVLRTNERPVALEEYLTIKRIVVVVDVLVCFVCDAKLRILPVDLLAIFYNSARLDVRNVYCIHAANDGGMGQ